MSERLLTTGQVAELALSTETVLRCPVCAERKFHTPRLAQRPDSPPCQSDAGACFGSFLAPRGLWAEDALVRRASIVAVGLASSRNG